MKREEEYTNETKDEEGINVKCYISLRYTRRENIAKRIDKICGEELEGNTVIGGDFNVKIGELGGAEWLGYGERYSKDKIVGGKNLGWFMKKVGMF